MFSCLLNLFYSFTTLFLSQVLPVSFLNQNLALFSISFSMCGFVLLRIVLAKKIAQNCQEVSAQQKV